MNLKGTTIKPIKGFTQCTVILWNSLLQVINEAKTHAGLTKMIGPGYEKQEHQQLYYIGLFF